MLLQLARRSRSPGHRLEWFGGSPHLAGLRKDEKDRELRKLNSSHTKKSIYLSEWVSTTNHLN